MTTSYLLPAILLNPAIILHLINTLATHLLPPPLSTISHSPHPYLERLGPLPGSLPYLDVHADDQLCWRYTIAMVIVQLFAFGRVQDNRVRRRDAREKVARKIEAEKIRDGDGEVVVGVNGNANGNGNGIHLPGKGMIVDVDGGKEVVSSSEESTTEPSEEEMML